MNAELTPRHFSNDLYESYRLFIKEGHSALHSVFADESLIADFENRHPPMTEVEFDEMLSSISWTERCDFIRQMQTGYQLSRIIEANSMIANAVKRVVGRSSED